MSKKEFEKYLLTSFLEAIKFKVYKLKFNVGDVIFDVKLFREVCETPRISVTHKAWFEEDYGTTQGKYLFSLENETKVKEQLETLVRNIVKSAEKKYKLWEGENIFKEIN